MLKDLLKTLLCSIGSVAALFLLTKLIGKRQISELSLFDYINGITIGSIAAEMAIGREDEVFKALLAMVIYAAASFAISVASEHSFKLRRFITGKTVILWDNGKLYRDSFKKARLDLNEFLSLCRRSGYFHLNDLQSAFLEPNGQVSFLPKSNKRPATPEDMKLPTTQEYAPAIVILDGEVMKENLRAIGKDPVWLERQLHADGIANAKEIFLATCDQDGQLEIHRQITEKVNHTRLD